MSKANRYYQCGHRVSPSRLNAKECFDCIVAGNMRRLDAGTPGPKAKIAATDADARPARTISY